MNILRGVYLDEILKYAGRYEFSFQFWGESQNNVWIYKGGVELISFGGRDTPEELFKEVVEWIYRVNRVPHSKRIGCNPNFD